MVVSAFTDRDKRLLWHPRQENKFVVGGGSDITLYEWAPDDPGIRHITSQHDLQFMKVRNSKTIEQNTTRSMGYVHSASHGPPIRFLTI